MTTLTAAPLTDSQQMLIDARLDTIDRMLMTRVSRADRMAIVREVESQIQELLGELDQAEVTRENVLDILKRLDPPEAYLPEDTEIGQLSSSPRFATSSPTLVGKAKPVGISYGKIGGIVGLCSFGLIFLFPILYFLVALFESELLAILGFSAVSLLGVAGTVTGLVLSIRGRREGIVPIFGIIAALIAMPFYFLGMVFTVYIVMNM